VAVRVDVPDSVMVGNKERDDAGVRVMVGARVTVSVA